MLLLTIITATSYAAVEKRYVGDKIWLQLRSGPGSEFRILKALPSGEHLIFREQTADKNYTKVTTDKGVEGWVLTRFLEDEPIAKEKLILSQRELAKVKAELDTLKQQTKTLSE
jgi:SH3 domain protein